jgi:hypothetical protein
MVIIRDQSGKVVFNEPFDFQPEPKRLGGNVSLDGGTLKIDEATYSNNGSVLLPKKLIGKHVISIFHMDKVYGTDLYRFEINF